MNVYDFDKTIYDGDSSVNFYKFCVRKKPSVLKYLPVQLWAFFKYLVRAHDKTAMKEVFYRYFAEIDDVDLLLYEFWEKNMSKIKNWYTETKRDDDVIISASPEFLLEYPCKMMNIHLIASVVDKKTGKYDGKNCHGEEKVSRFYKEFEKGSIDKFYSDSYSDAPLAKIANESFMVKGNRIFEWKFK